MINSRKDSLRDVIQFLPPYADMEPESQELLAQNATLHFGLPEGETVISPTGRSVVSLLSGCAELESPRRRGICYFGSGDILGDEAALRRTTYPFTARARTSCDVLVISGEAFRTLWLKSPVLQRNLSNLYRERADAWEDFHDAFQRASRPARIALALRTIAQALDHRKIVAWDNACLPFEVEWFDSKRAIADALSVCPPIVRETLPVLAKAGAIDIGDWERDRKIRLPLTLNQECIPILTKLVETIL